MIGLNFSICIVTLLLHNNCVLKQTLSLSFYIALIYTHLKSTTTTPLHQIADVFWLNARSNKWLYIVVVELLQLHTCKYKKYTNMYKKADTATGNDDNVKLHNLTTR